MLLATNHQKTLIAPFRVTANHNQTVVRTAPGIQLQHNQTLIQPKHMRRMTANHNQTVVRPSR